MDHKLQLLKPLNKREVFSTELNRRNQLTNSGVTLFDGLT
jgi:hypothetical protein